MHIGGLLGSPESRIFSSGVKDTLIYVIESSIEETKNELCDSASS